MNASESHPSPGQIEASLSGMPESASQDVRVHVQRCDRCRQRRKELARLDGLLRSVGHMSPSEGFADRVIRRAPHLGRGSSTLPAFLAVTVIAVVFGGALLLGLAGVPEAGPAVDALVLSFGALLSAIAEALRTLGPAGAQISVWLQAAAAHPGAGLFALVGLLGLAGMWWSGVAVLGVLFRRPLRRRLRQFVRGGGAPAPTRH